MTDLLTEMQRLDPAAAVDATHHGFPTPDEVLADLERRLEADAVPLVRPVRQRRRDLLLAAAAFVAVIVVGAGLWVLLARGEPQVVEQPTTTSPGEPTALPGIEWTKVRTIAPAEPPPWGSDHGRRALFPVAVGDRFITVAENSAYVSRDGLGWVGLATADFCIECVGIGGQEGVLPFAYDPVLELFVTATVTPNGLLTIQAARPPQEPSIGVVYRGQSVGEPVTREQFHGFDPTCEEPFPIVGDGYHPECARVAVTVGERGALVAYQARTASGAMYSADGTTWAPIALPFALPDEGFDSRSSGRSLLRATADGFYALDADGNIWFSPDASQWESMFCCLEPGGGRFRQVPGIFGEWRGGVVAGDYRVVMHVTPDGAEPLPLEAAAGAAGELGIVGQIEPFMTHLRVSVDGTQWVETPLPADFDFENAEDAVFAVNADTILVQMGVNIWLGKMVEGAAGASLVPAPGAAGKAPIAVPIEELLSIETGSGTWRWRRVDVSALPRGNFVGGSDVVYWDSIDGMLASEDGSVWEFLAPEEVGAGDAREETWIDPGEITNPPPGVYDDVQYRQVGGELFGRLFALAFADDTTHYWIDDGDDAWRELYASKWSFVARAVQLREHWLVLIHRGHPESLELPALEIFLSDDLTLTNWEAIPVPITPPEYGFGVGIFGDRLVLAGSDPNSPYPIGDEIFIGWLSD